MTTITVTEAFKSKQNFSEFMAEQHPQLLLQHWLIIQRLMEKLSLHLQS